MPKVSICLPIYNMDNALYFLERNLYSIMAQTFKDYEVVVSDDSEDDMLKIWLNKLPLPIVYVKNLGNHGMANNTNNAINHASGELIKILFQDDYFYHNGSLEEIVKHFTDRTTWLVTGCTHSMDGVNTFNDHRPYYQENENGIGSPSVLTFRGTVQERFDSNFHWVLDLDLYKRLYRLYGKPKVYDKTNVVIGVGLHQKTNKLTDERKALEHKLIKQKYEHYPSFATNI